MIHTYLRCDPAAYKVIGTVVSLDEGPPLDSIVAGDRAATAPWSIAKPLSGDARAGDRACAILRHDASKPLSAWHSSGYWAASSHQCRS